MHTALRHRVRAFVFTLNAPLVIGAVLALLIITTLLAAPFITDQSPVKMNLPTAGNSHIAYPAPPGTPGHPLGTDVEGRDMLARLLYGGRYTLIICTITALARILIGTTIGLLAGWYPCLRWLMNSIISAWSAVPPIFFALFMLEILARIFFKLPRFGPKNASVLLTDAMIFTIFMSLTGWPEIAIRCQTATIGLSRQPFIEAAKVIGLRRATVLWRHVLPNLHTLLLPEAINALAAALLLLAELGFLRIFIGGGTEDLNGSKYLIPLYAEWGSMVALSLRQRNQGYWILIEPLLAFTLSIVAFSLMAEGLRRRHSPGAH